MAATLDVAPMDDKRSRATGFVGDSSVARPHERVRNYYDDYNGLRDIGIGYNVDTRCAGLKFEFVLDRHGVEECGTSD